MEILSALANICSILAFFVSIFIANEAVKISKKINVTINNEEVNTNKQFAMGKNKQNMKVGK